MRTYLGTPEPFNSTTDDWNDYMKRFKHFVLANGVTEDVAFVPYVNWSVYI